MSRIKSAVIFLLLALSLAALFWLTSSRTPWQIFQKQEMEEGTAISLGDLAGQNYDRMGFAGGVVRYTARDRGWIVGTERGELFHFDEEGRQKWMHPLGTGHIKALAVSADGGTIYAGESSAEGNLYAIDAEKGDILWQFSGASVIGRDLSIRSMPAPVHISVDENGHVYAAFFRFSLAPDGSRLYIARILAFDKDGTELWRYPEKENMDCWPAWNTVSTKAGLLAFGTSNYDNLSTLRYNKNIYLLHLADGTEAGSTVIPAAPQFASTTMRNGPNFSPDGQYLTAMASDGRAFLFDNTGKLLWMRPVSGAEKAAGSWINAAGRDAYVVSGGVVFGTINTFTRENWQTPSPVLHPSSNTMFFFRLNGDFLWKYQAGGEIEEMDFGGGRAALAVGRNVRTHNYKVHGAAAVDLSGGKEISFFHTAGPVQSIAISADGRRMAGIEVPAVTPEGSLLGAYRLHLWDLK